MINQEYKSVEEIDATFSAHRQSLKDSGVEFDDAKLLRSWVDAIKEFEDNL